MIQDGQTYQSCNPRGGPRIRIKKYRPGDSHAHIVDAHSGKRFRQILVSELHESPMTKYGRPRRTGYVLVVDAMTPERWARIVELERAATPGPWESRDTPDHWSLHMEGGPFQILKAPKKGTPYAEYWPDLPTGDFITESRTMVSELIREVTRRGNEIDQLRGDTEYWRELAMDKLSAKRRLAKELRDKNGEIDRLEWELHHLPPSVPKILDTWFLEDWARVITDPGSVLERETVNGRPESVPRWAARALAVWLPIKLMEAIRYLERSNHNHVAFLGAFLDEQQHMRYVRMQHRIYFQDAATIIGSLIPEIKVTTHTVDLVLEAQGFAERLGRIAAALPDEGDYR